MVRFHKGDLSIEVPAFGFGERIPDRFAKANDNVSPEIRVRSVPEGTKSLAVLVHDPDAPVTDGWTHWLAWGIDPETTVIPEGVSGLPTANNTDGNPQWDGPAPPNGHGNHHYFFHLYALDTEIDPPTTISTPEFLRLIDDHIIEQARWVGTYSYD